MCFSSLSRKSSTRSKSNVSAYNELMPHRVSDGLKRFADDVSTSLSRVSGVVPEVVSSSADAFVNLSFLHRTTFKGAPPSSFVRRVSSASLDAVDPSPPAQPTAPTHSHFGTPSQHNLAAAYSISRKFLEEAINQEADKDAQSPEDLQTEETRLRQRLAKLNLDMIIMEGDGNCQFRSISYGLWGTQEHHARVRRDAVEYMVKNSAMFAVYLGEDWKQYVKSMAQPYTWGDELTLRAVCEAYCIAINIISSTQKNWYLKYVPGRLGHSADGKPAEIWLTYVSPIHYNAIKRRAGLTPIKESLGFGRAGSISEAYAKARTQRIHSQLVDGRSVV